MTPRERVLASLAHQEPDRIPLDVSPVLNTGIHVSTLYKLKVALGLIRPGDPIKVVDPYQMPGEIDDDLRRALEVDTVPLLPYKTCLEFVEAGFDVLSPVQIPADGVDPQKLKSEFWTVFDFLG